MDNNYILKEILVQVLGFGVVFLILKKLAWGKILGAVDARRKTIEDSFTSIEKQKQDLVSLEKEYRARLENIEQEARKKIQEAAEKGNSLAADIQEKARVDAQKMVDRAKADIEQDIAKSRIQMRRDVVELSTLISEKILKEKLDTPGQDKLVERYLTELEKIG